MILPAGVDKGSGFAAALARLHLRAENCLGIGDAENDGAFLSRCGLSAAVANAIPALKTQVDLVLAGEDGAGVMEAIERILQGAEEDPFGSLSTTGSHF
jgi:hydroxymethylpyrimidine pyrophosphatase-like HAD family hydrolase